MTDEPKIDARRLDRTLGQVHTEEQREHAGEPPQPEHDPDEPPPGDGDDPGQRRRPRVDPNDPRPEIVLSVDQPAVTDAAIRALAQMGGVWVRGRSLVHIVRDRGAPEWMHESDPESPAAKRRAASWEGVPVILPIEREHLPDLLCRAAVWISIRKNRQGSSERVLTAPPSWLAGRILARGQWPQLPQLEGISGSPVFRADGSIHDKPGYDERTRIIFESDGVVFPAIPPAPTLDDARRAYAELVEPYSEFPFQADSDRAAIVAFVLSIVGRAAINGQVPMFEIGASTPGSGKGLADNVSCLIATGRMATLIPPTGNEDEMRKRLLALALESPATVTIDNVEGELRSAVLAMALTSGEVTDRLLGVTKMARATLRPVWAFTGNNVRLAGDLGRRVVPIALDPKCETPEDREFKRPDLLDYVRRNRPRLLVAAMTILRAYVIAGRPPHGKPPKGSYEAWDRLIRGAIIWTSGVDPLAGTTRIREESDDDIDRLRTLLLAWEGAFGGTEASVSEAIKHAGDSGDLYHALLAYCTRTGKIDAQAIGLALRKMKGRMVNNKRFARGTDNHIKTATWRIETIGAKAASAGTAGTAGTCSNDVRGAAHAD